MKILHITYMSPLSPNSGIPAVLKNLAEEQNKLSGVEARVLSLRASVDNIESIFFDDLKEKSLGDYLDSYKPDFAIFHSFFDISFSYASFVLWIKKIPFFIEPHGAFGRNSMKKSRIKKWVANKTVFKYLLSGAIGYIYTNNNESTDSIYHKPYLIIPNGVLKDVVLSSSNKNFDKEKSPIFYFLGRYNVHHKGLDYLFDALDILDKTNQKVTMYIYGTGSEKEISYVRKRISRYKNIDIQEKGTIYGDEKKKALESANILILTSRYEGSPMTILDGMCYGNPCLVTPGTNVSKEVVENSIGWESRLDANSIAECIVKAQFDYKKDFQNYVIRCKKYVVENYTWSKIAEDSICQYKKILNASRR